MMDTALKRVRDYQDSEHYSRYSDYTCAVCDDGYEDDIAFDGASSYTLHHYRRASFIVWHRSDGFKDCTEYDSASAADAAFQGIQDAIEDERQAAALEAHPDVWVVHAPSGYPYGYDARHSDREDALDEWHRVFEQVMIESKRGARICWEELSANETFEVTDSEDAIMSHPLCGTYWIEHVDNSDERERYLGWL